MLSEVTWSFFTLFLPLKIPLKFCKNKKSTFLAFWKKINKKMAEVIVVIMKIDFPIAFRYVVDQKTSFGP